MALVVKNLPAKAEDLRDAGSIPGLGRYPGGGHGNPLQYSCLQNPMDRVAWWAMVYRVAKSRTWLKRVSILPSQSCGSSFFFSLHCSHKALKTPHTQLSVPQPSGNARVIPEFSSNFSYFLSQISLAHSLFSLQSPNKTRVGWFSLWALSTPSTIVLLEHFTHPDCLCTDLPPSLVETSRHRETKVMSYSFSTSHAWQGAWHKVFSKYLMNEWTYTC